MVVAAVVAAVAALVAPAAVAERGTARSVTSLDALEGQVLTAINRVRTSRGLAPLRLSKGLGAAADAHSRAMVRGGFFAHESADGSAFWKRVERFYPPQRFRTWSAGENLLWYSPTLDAAAAVEMWMKSPGHRRNLLDRTWREIGISAIHAASAPGVFGGAEVTVLTANFGVRA